MITARINAPIGNPVCCMVMVFAPTVGIGFTGTGFWTFIVTDASVGYKLGS